MTLPRGRTERLTITLEGGQKFDCSKAELDITTGILSYWPSEEENPRFVAASHVATLYQEKTYVYSD